MSESKPSIYELRTKSVQELSKKYNRIPEWALDRLRWASNQYVYPIITDHSLSMDDMAELSHKSLNTIKFLRSTLVRYEYDEPLKTERFVPREISQTKLEIIDNLLEEAMTSKEIADETGKSLNMIYSHLNDLRQADIISSHTLKLKNQTKKSPNFHKLKEISNISINYVVGCEELLADKIIGYLPETEEMTISDKKSLKFIINELPREASFKVLEYLRNQE